MRRSLPGLLAIAALAACAKAGSASPPTHPTFAAAVRSGGMAAPDTIIITSTCAAPTPTTGCSYSFSDAVSGQTANGAVTLNAVFTGKLTCSAPGAVAKISGSVIGTAAGLTNSAPETLSEQDISCPFKTAATPSASFTLTVKNGG